MCNLYSSAKSVDEVRRWFDRLQMTLRFPEGLPNLQPVDIVISDRGPIVRASIDAPGEYELIVRRWSWPGAGGRPVYNFRSEGREFATGRCLVISSGFYEFTNPADPKHKRKDRWLFASPDAELIGIAGLVRKDPGVGEVFTMLTTEPGPDVAPYHNRQVAVLPSSEWRGWLDHSVPAHDLLGPAPAGSLTVQAANR